MKKFLVLVLMCLIGASLVPSAIAEIDVNYAIMPAEGSSTQQILVWVRVEPMIELTTSYYLSVFWDTLPTNIMREPDILLKNGAHEHRWDKYITPPAGYNEVGKHMINIWIESNTGELRKLNYQYEITSGPLTTVDAWELFIKENPEILAQIRGPKGDDGSPGAAGARGVKGEAGERGPVAVVDYVELWLSVPPEVLADLKGDQGPQGVQGEPASVVMFALVFVVSVFASAVFTWVYAQKKEAVA